MYICIYLDYEICIYKFVKGYLEVILQRIDETRYGTSGVIRKSHKHGDEGSDGDF